MSQERQTADSQTPAQRTRRPGPTVRLLALLLSMGMLVLGFGLQGTLISVRAGTEGMSTETLGVIMSAYFVGFIGGSLFFPRLVENVGHIRTFAALASIASAVALALATFIEPLTWILLRTLHGACYAGMLLIVESWLNTATGRSRRGRVLALYGVVLYGAWAGSQPLLNIAPVSGFLLFMLISAIMSLALVPITLTRTGGPGVVKASRASLSRLYQLSPLALAGVLAVGITTNSFFSMGPRFAQLIGFSEGEIAAFISLNLVGAMTFQWPLGWLSDRVDRRAVIVLTTVGAGVVTSLFVVLNPNGPLALLALAFGLGGFALPLYSICIAQMNDQIEEDEVVAVASGLIMVFGAGSILGPFVAGVFMGQLGPAGLFIFMAAILWLYSGLAFWDAYRSRGTPDVPQQEKDSFVAMPQTSHTSTRLHKHGSRKRAKGKMAPR